MRFKDKILKTTSTLIQYLGKDTANYKGPIWFRGQAVKSYRLTPGCYRKNFVNTEMTLMQKFRQNATLLLNNTDRKEFEWLFIMQHHGVPTRLLDWSESPLVGLFFACTENPKSDGALWCLLPVELNKHAGIKPEETFNIPSLDDNSLANYDPLTFKAERDSEMLPVAAITVRNTPRMQSQLGTFTIFHRDKKPIEDIGDSKHVWRYIIPQKYKKRILQELRLLGINKFTLFPELQSIGETIREIR